MKYDPARHPAFADYLEAVDQTLAAARAPAPNRDEIRENLVAQFEEVSSGAAPFEEEAYVASLDDPHGYAEPWETSEPAETGGPTAPRPTARKWWLLGLLAALLLLALAGAGTAAYLIQVRNEIIVARTSIKASWAQVETTLQRRYDLIPNLVNTVKGFATQERTVLEEVTRLRSQWGQARTPGQQRQAATELEGAVMKLVALSEQYPNLASNEQFLSLQFQLEGTENRIAVARTRYNDVLRSYNALTQQFPGSLFQYPPNEEFFESQREAKAAPQVLF